MSRLSSFAYCMRLKRVDLVGGVPIPNLSDSGSTLAHYSRQYGSASVKRCDHLLHFCLYCFSAKSSIKTNSLFVFTFFSTSK